MKTHLDQTFLFRQFRDMSPANLQALKAGGRGVEQSTSTGRLPWALRVWQKVNEGLNSLYRLHERNPAVMLERRSDSAQLGARKVMRLMERSGIERIHVREGIVWLTSTPAGGDVLLRAGEQYTLKDGWPFVVEALADARVDLLR